MVGFSKWHRTHLLRDPPLTFFCNREELVKPMLIDLMFQYFLPYLEMT